MASSWPWNGVLDGQMAPSWPWTGVLGTPAAPSWPWNDAVDAQTAKRPFRCAGRPEAPTGNLWIDVCMYVCTRWGLLDRTCKALAGKLRGRSCKSCLQARAAKRKTTVKPARFLFAFRLLITVSKRSKKAEGIARKSYENCRKSTKYQSEIEEKSIKIDEKLTKIRLWAALDAQSCFGGVPGCGRGGSGTHQSRSRTDLGRLRASQERPGAVQKPARAGPKTFPDRPGALPERVWSSER